MINGENKEGLQVNDSQTKIVKNLKVNESKVEEYAKEAKTGKVKFILIPLMVAFLAVKGPDASNEREVVAYAAEIADDTEDKAIDENVVKNETTTVNAADVVAASSAAMSVSEYRTENLSNFKKVYKTYKKSYYSSKEYKKLTKYYKKGVKAIKAATTNAKIKKAYDKYVKILNNIKPSVLVKYQDKLVASLTKTYNSLIAKNEYSDSNLSKLEEIKDEGIENIYSAVTKTKAKSAKTSAEKKCKKVEVKTNVNGTNNEVDKLRNNFISYVNNNNNLTPEQKNTIIENANSLTTVEQVEELAEIWGYEETKTEETVITVEQVENKIKELRKKYPKYSEDEIRVLVATANMDHVNSEDVLTIFKVNSKDELDKKKELLDDLLIEISEVYGYKRLGLLDDSYFSSKLERVYEDLVDFEDAFIYERDFENATFVSRLSKRVASNGEKTTSGDDVKLGDRALMEMVDYLYGNKDRNYLSFEYDNGYVYDINDKALDGTAVGYMTKKIIVNIYCTTADNYLDRMLPGGKRDSIFEYEDKLEKENPFEKIEVKIK